MSSVKTVDLGRVTGSDGKSAYTAAQEAGYGGTETQFGEALAGTPGHIADKNNPHGVTAAQVGARPADWIPTAADVGARPVSWVPTAAQVGALSTSGGTVSGDINLGGYCILNVQKVHGIGMSLNGGRRGISISDNGVILEDYYGPGNPVHLGGVKTPSADNDAANKKYVDETVAAAIAGAIGGSY